MSLNREEEQILQRVILVGADTGEYDAAASMDELEELAYTAGGETVGRLIQKRPSYDPATCIGAGKLAELKELSLSLEAELLIFDCELSSTQLRNIEDITEMAVVDRTALILDIFAKRARSAEGKLQVELAQQKYRLPRLSGMGTALSRLGGGIGTRGPGETQLETDRRHIRRRIGALEEQLEELSLRRDRQRVRRDKDGVLRAAIVGYTNAGKSTLLNALTNAGVLAEDKLFATLDTTSRGITLPDGREVILIDTVGLISRLPHQLVEAFKSTLEEAASADLLIHVTDISDPDWEEKVYVTDTLLGELGCKDMPRIMVYNKIDAIEEGVIPAGYYLKGREMAVGISAKNGVGLEGLLEGISAGLPVTSQRMTLLLPYDQGGILERVRAMGKIFAEEYREDGIMAEAMVARRLEGLVRPYVQTAMLKTHSFPPAEPGTETCGEQPR